MISKSCDLKRVSQHFQRFKSTDMLEKSQHFRYYPAKKG
jgi:hypothetical protein